MIALQKVVHKLDLAGAFHYNHCKLKRFCAIRILQNYSFIIY